MINLYNKDCMPALESMDDNQYDLAIVDPPYGINIQSIMPEKNVFHGNRKASPGDYKKKEWDRNRPNKKYFYELFRVSKNQIIWGANYYPEYLKKSMGWVFWDKDNGTSAYSDGELAFTSFDSALRKIKIRWYGMLQENMKDKENRIHPTQKPVKLYEWILTNYAKEGDSILDTHLGSGSIAIACHNLKFSLTAYEIDKDYLEAASKRLEEHKKQMVLF